MEMDQNGDGVLSLSELHQALRSKGAHLPAELASQLLQSSDLNADGVIDYNEFLGATVSHALPSDGKLL